MQFREFKSAAELRAHYAAIKQRLNPGPSKADKQRERAERMRRHDEHMREVEQRCDDIKRRRVWGVQIVRVAAAHFGVEFSDVRSKSQHREHCDPRFVACYLLRERFGAGEFGDELGSLVWIGRIVRRDHTSVLNAVKRVATSPRLLAEAAIVRLKLNQLQEGKTTYAEIVDEKHRARALKKESWEQDRERREHVAQRLKAIRGRRVASDLQQAPSDSAPT